MIRKYLHTIGGDREEHGCFPLTPEAHAARVEAVAKALYENEHSVRDVLPDAVYRKLATAALAAIFGEGQP